jgi:hypothetical protein
MLDNHLISYWTTSLKHLSKLQDAPFLLQFVVITYRAVEHFKNASDYYFGRVTLHDYKYRAYAL